MPALALTIALVAAVAAPAQIVPQKPVQSATRTTPENGFIFWNMSRKSVDFLLQPVPQTDSDRLAQLKQTFADVQCTGSSFREQITPRGKNLLCILPAAATATFSEPTSGSVAAPHPGSQSGTILFIAHYEHEGPGQSAVGNWSGAIMLPFLYHALSATPRYHTFLFATVDGESGAKALFDSLTPAQRHDIKGVVALDALGLGPVQFYISPDDSNMRNNSGYPNMGWLWLDHQIREAAIDQKLAAPLPAIPGSWFKTDVTRDFRHHNVPSILIHSVTFNTRDLPGSTRDAASAIDRDVYFNTFSFLAYYGAELDKPWPSPTITGASTPSGGRRR